MKTQIYLTTIVLILSFSTGLSQVSPWASNPSGSLEDEGKDVVIDNAGDIYVIGNFTSPDITFNEGLPTEIILSGSASNDFYVAKYHNSTGEVIWAIAGNGTGDDFGNGIDISSSGNLFICGTFTSPSLVIGTETITHTGAGADEDYFVAQINPTTGSVLAGYNPSTPSVNESALDISVHDVYGLLIAGYSGVSPDRDPLAAAIDPLTGTVTESIYITGSADDLGSAIDVNHAGKVCISGSFNSPVLDFPGTAIPSLANSSANSDLFVVYTDITTSWTIEWALNPAGSENEAGEGIAIDPSGNVIVTGHFDSPDLEFSPGVALSNTCTVCGPGYRTKDLFVVKIDATGAPLWVKGADGGSGNWNFDDSGMDIAVNAFGEIFVTGYFKSSEINFGLGTIFNTTNNNYADLFVIKYDASGFPIWTVSPTEVYDEYGYGIAVQDEGQCCAITGRFNSSSLDILGTLLSNTSSGMEVGDALVFSVCDSCNCNDVSITEWYFGNETGIGFSGPVAPLTTSNIVAGEGCSVIHDADGNMLFYTNGVTIWDRDHNEMPGSGGLYGHQSSTQSALIVPKPCSDHIYYIFTTGYWSIDEHGLNYSIVDMNLRSGLGDVVPGYRNINLLPEEQATEKVTAVTHANGKDVWIITHKYNSLDFLSYLLSKDGLSDPVTSTIGSAISIPYHNKAGYLSASADGDLLANAMYENLDVDFELFRFNQETGEVYEMIESFNHGLGYCYGAEFSPDGTKFYASTLEEVMQYDMITETWTTLNIDSIGSHFGALMRAPDNKIYIARNDMMFVDVIHNPNETGTACNYEQGGLFLGEYCYLGLPQCYENHCINAGFFAEENIIPEGESIQFNDVSTGEIFSWSWTFPGGSPASSTERFPVISYPAMGVYEVSLTVTGPEGTDTETKTAYIHVGTTNINEEVPNSGHLKAYPNPTNGTVTLELPGQECDIRVHNIQGQTVLNQKAHGPFCKLDLGSLQKGAYFVTAISADSGMHFHTKVILR